MAESEAIVVHEERDEKSRVRGGDRGLRVSWRAPVLSLRHKMNDSLTASPQESC